MNRNNRAVMNHSGIPGGVTNGSCVTHDDDLPVLLVSVKCWAMSETMAQVATPPVGGPPRRRPRQTDLLVILNGLLPK
jgi:hypothetical protein